MTRVRSIPIFLVLAFAWLTFPNFGPTFALAGSSAARVGGPCAYADFPGTAVIVSVTPHPASPANAPAAGAQMPPPGSGYDVVFTFTPDAPILGEPLYQPGRSHTLTLVNGTAPGPKFLQKYGIAPGKTFACRLRLIRKGTCTPMLFAFPDIDLTDYFEQKP